MSRREPIGLAHLSYHLAIIPVRDEAPSDRRFRIRFPVLQRLLFPPLVELERFRTLAVIVVDVWIGVLAVLERSLQILLAFDFAFYSNNKRRNSSCSPFLVAFMLHKREDANLIPRPCLQAAAGGACLVRYAPQSFALSNYNRSSPKLMEDNRGFAVVVRLIGRPFCLSGTVCTGAAGKTKLRG